MVENDMAYCSVCERRVTTTVSIRSGLCGLCTQKKGDWCDPSQTFDKAVNLLQFFEDDEPLMTRDLVDFTGDYRKKVYTYAMLLVKHGLLTVTTGKGRGGKGRTNIFTITQAGLREQEDREENNTWHKKITIEQ